IPDLREKTGEERPTAVEEDHGAQDRRDPGQRIGNVVTEPPGNHVAGEHHRKSQQQAPPEPGPKHRGMITVVVPVATVPVLPVATMPVLPVAAVPVLLSVLVFVPACGRLPVLADVHTLCPSS